jgi:hypothetical protein
MDLSTLRVQSHCELRPIASFTLGWYLRHLFLWLDLRVVIDTAVEVTLESLSGVSRCCDRFLLDKA